MDPNDLNAIEAEVVKEKEKLPEGLTKVGNRYYMKGRKGQISKSEVDLLMKK